MADVAGAGVSRTSAIRRPRLRSAIPHVYTSTVSSLIFLPVLNVDKAAQAGGAASSSVLLKASTRAESIGFKRPQDMQRFLSAAINECAIDSTFVLDCLGSTDKEGLRRIEEICSCTFSIQVDLLHIHILSGAMVQIIGTMQHSNGLCNDKAVCFAGCQQQLHCILSARHLCASAFDKFTILC